MASAAADNTKTDRRRQRSSKRGTAMAQAAAPPSARPRRIPIANDE